MERTMDLREEWVIETLELLSRTPNTLKVEERGPSFWASHRILGVTNADKFHPQNSFSMEPFKLELDDGLRNLKRGSMELDQDDDYYSPDETKKTPAKNRRLGTKRPRWTEEEDFKLLELKKKFGDMSWAKISQSMEDRTSSQCYQRWHRVLNPAILKGPWSKDETDTLGRVVKQMDTDKISWSQVARHIPGRTDIQCRYQYLKMIRCGKQKFNKSKMMPGSPEEPRKTSRLQRKKDMDISPIMVGEVEVM